MSKELEALKRMEYFVNEEMGIKTFKQSVWHIEGTDDYEIVREALQRLEAIDNAKPSEALKKLKENAEMFDEIAKENDHTYKEDTVIEAYVYHFNNIVIEQALLKAQEKNDKEIAFDLIDTKNVDIKLLKWAYPSVEAYNVRVREQKDTWKREELTPEEFEFLGRLVGAK